MDSSRTIDGRIRFLTYPNGPKVVWTKLQVPWGWSWTLTTGLDISNRYFTPKATKAHNIMAHYLRTKGFYGVPFSPALYGESCQYRNNTPCLL
ncbi:hypothetical protein DTO212C5_979 [Paecilomyces variotii]|nr:hypothetical protein DTO212C5_979 [Paecilomyces variotii]